MVNHIRFVSTNKAVCQKPSTIGHDLIVVNYDKGENCQTCFALISAYNERERRYELSLALPPSGSAAPHPNMTVRQAIALGMVLATGVWLSIVLMVWAVLYG